jgi:hypothetical protein
MWRFCCVQPAWWRRCYSGMCPRARQRASPLWRLCIWIASGNRNQHRLPHHEHAHLGIVYVAQYGFDRGGTPQASQPGAGAVGRSSDRRVTQFWDPRRVLSQAIRKDHVVWDYVAIYPAGVRWDDAVPAPLFSGSPVVRVIDGFRRQLRATRGHEPTKGVLPSSVSSPQQRDCADHPGLPRGRRLRRRASASAAECARSLLPLACRWQSHRPAPA